MTAPSPQPADAVVALHAGCRRWLALLSELTALHVAIDTPERQPGGADEDISLRLRKAYFHVVAVLDWPIDTLIVHVMGPEIRTAMRHLTPIVSGFMARLDQHRGNKNLPAARRGFTHIARCCFPSHTADSDPSPTSGVG